MQRLATLFYLTAAIAVPLCPALAQAPATRWTVEVIQVENRPAEGLAQVLREILPPGVRIVADPATNKLLIAGPREQVRRLLAEPAAQRATRESRDRSKP